MTPIQVGLLKFITRYIDQNGSSPSYSEICVAMNMKSRSYVGQMLKGLAEANMITFIPRRSRSIQLVTPVTRNLKDLLASYDAGEIESLHAVEAMRTILNDAEPVK